MGRSSGAGTGTSVPGCCGGMHRLHRSGGAGHAQARASTPCATSGLMLGSHHLIGAKANRPVLGAWSRAGRGNRRLEDDGAGDAHPPQGLVDTRGRCSDESDWDALRPLDLGLGSYDIGR